MHTRRPSQVLARSENLSFRESESSGARFEISNTHYQISLGLHDLPLRHVKIDASEGSILIVGDNVLRPTDDFDEWLQAGCARFSARIGLPEDADVPSMMLEQIGDTLVVTMARKAAPPADSQGAPTGLRAASCSP